MSLSEFEFDGITYQVFFAFVLIRPIFYGLLVVQAQG